ncbi:hypothetical protein ACQ4PT_053776 [Festuca glaucescens]
MANPFEAHAVFSCNGHAVWGDLAQGIVYCDLGDLTDDTTEPVVFKVAMLPEECRTRYDKYDIDQDAMPVFRTMSRVGDSIWFVLIEPSFDCPGDTKVKLWALDLPSEEWSLRREFSMQSVFELEVFMAWGSPETAPEFPFLRRQTDVENGAALYMFLREPYRGGYPYAHLVCTDLSGSSEVEKSCRRQPSEERLRESRRRRCLLHLPRAHGRRDASASTLKTPPLPPPLRRRRSLHLTRADRSREAAAAAIHTTPSSQLFRSSPRHPDGWQTWMVKALAWRRDEYCRVVRHLCKRPKAFYVMSICRVSVCMDSGCKWDE